MRKTLLLVLATLLLFGVVPAGAATDTSSVACPDVDGRERLTLDGAKSTFEAPFAAPLMAATGEYTTGIAGYRRALWQYQADLAPVSAATVTIDLKWADSASDYDIFVSDAEGMELARGDRINAADQVFTEQAVFEAAHCEVFSISVTNYLGQPLAPLDLTVTVTPTEGAKPLACREADTAPGCAGKAAGAAPDRVADARSFYYLSGDPGQGSMIYKQQGAEDVPFRSNLSTTRPTGAKPNSYTAPPVGFNAYQNPFQAYFTTTWEQPRRITGDVTALVWVSSRTMRDAAGTLTAELFAEGASVGKVQIPGADISEDPTPLSVRFPNVDVETVDVTLQIGKEPVASSNGTTSSPGNATYTLWYDSVQFPSRLTLP